LGKKDGGLIGKIKGLFGGEGGSLPPPDSDPEIDSILMQIDAELEQEGF